MRLFFVIAFVMQCATALTQEPSPLHSLTQLQDVESKRISSTDADLKNGNTDYREIQPGGTLTLAEIDGAGAITHLWMTVASNERGYPRLLLLRIYWDGEESPSVECPLGDFFGIGHGLENYTLNSIPVRVSSSGKAYNSYWRMPFQKSARITVTNEGKQKTHRFYYHVDYEMLESQPEKQLYFHAQYRQSFPAKTDRNYLIADIAGKGNYIGTVLNCLTRSPGWWGEGDEFFFIDGEEAPSITGTGVEDYFGDAWGFVQDTGSFYGSPVVWQKPSGHLFSSYRWHIPDPVRFTKSLRLEIENKGYETNRNGDVNWGKFVQRADYLSSVAFWYQQEPHKPFSKIPYGHERLNYDYTKYTEAEKHIENTKVNAGQTVEQPFEKASNQAFLLWNGVEKEAGEISVTFAIEESGDYELLLSLVHDKEYGVFDILIDNTVMEERRDMFLPYIDLVDYVYPVLRLEKGNHTLTFRNRGKHEHSFGYGCGIDGFLLMPR